MTKERMQEFNEFPDGTQVSVAILAGRYCLAKMPRAKLYRAQAENVWVAIGTGKMMIYITEAQRVTVLHPGYQRPHIRIDVANIKSRARKAGAQMTKRANTVITGRDTCALGGREYRAVPARRGCDGCAAMPGHLGRRDTALCHALPPCAGFTRGGGGDIIWVTRGGRPRKLEAGA